MTIVGSKANNVQNKKGSLTCIAHFIYVSSSCVLFIIIPLIYPENAPVIWNHAPPLGPRDTGGIDL